ncbi:MAG TPA: lipid-binding SYLF domain-containing protein [Bryobacteraceae bacterium]|nr:lipid-binding SYLF domain-containing protein [Bryobacteraceae bacterium]
MRKFTFNTVLILSLAAIATAETAQERLASSAEVFQEVMSTPDKGIPQDLLAKAQCVIIVPGLKKGAILLGGQYGRGFAECRKEDGFGWGPPAAVKVEGGSVGFQIGGSSTDVVMVVMNKRGMQKLLRDKFTLGADASVAAGPVGRTANAATDVRMDAEILAWSRSKGVFAGISLSGATLRPDADVNEELYGKKIGNREVLSGEVEPPPAAAALRSELDKYSMRK